METLEQALRRVAQARWQGRRCYATNMSQAGIAIAGVCCGLKRVPGLGRPVEVREVTQQAVQYATAGWYAAGVAPATINKRLNCLSALGVNVEGCRVREPKVLKWWLRPEDEERLVRWAESWDYIPGRFIALVQWTTRTGLRIEESLRLTWREVGATYTGMEVTVPGLKTATAQATLPLSREAGEILAPLKEDTWRRAPTGPVFGLTYEEANKHWQECRLYLGVSDNPTATLKALRRSAARHLHITKGMPLDMVRQYLRHEDIETTMGYLRLTGGYGTEEMRRWL